MACERQSHTQEGALPEKVTKKGVREIAASLGVSPEDLLPGLDDRTASAAVDYLRGIGDEETARKVGELLR